MSENFVLCAAVRPPVERIGREPGTPDAAVVERGPVKRKPYAGHGLGAKRRQPNVAAIAGPRGICATK